MDGLIGNTDGLVEHYVNMTLCKKNRPGLATENRTVQYFRHH